MIIPNYNDYDRIKSKINNKYLLSKINDENMNFIYAFSKVLGIKQRSFIDTMSSFQGLSHRFEIFLKKKNVVFINDSKATTFNATQSALSSLKNIYWILGGIPKKGDKLKLSKYKKNITKCYLIGKHVKFFKSQINGKLPFTITKNLKNSILQIHRDSNSIKTSNKSILLSPAAASFDQFMNFENRGNEFKRLCRLYARKFI